MVRTLKNVPMVFVYLKEMVKTFDWGQIQSCLHERSKRNYWEGGEDDKGVPSAGSALCSMAVK
jgi:hypothetical protein